MSPNRGRSVMSRSAPTLAAGLLCLGLVGCALAAGSRPPTTYDLVATHSFAGTKRPAPYQLLVYEPTRRDRARYQPPHGAAAGRPGVLLQGHRLERSAAAPGPDAHDRDLPEFRRGQVGERHDRPIRARHRSARLPDRCVERQGFRRDRDLRQAGQHQHRQGGGDQGLQRARAGDDRLRRAMPSPR